MALPANFLALLGQPGAKTLYWIEIEGLPYAYGSRAQPASFWTSLAASLRFEELRPYLPEVPGGVDARLNPLDGMASPGEFQFKLVDADGFLTQAANVGRSDSDPNTLWLTADAAASFATLSVGGNLSAWPASGVGYIGRTTFSYTGKGAGTLTGCVPGVYRSQNVAISKGSLVSQYPQHLGLRRCWFYLAMSATEVFAIADRVARYAGLIEDYDLSDPATWRLVVRTPEKELGESTTLFRGFRNGRLASSLAKIAPGGALGPATQQVEYTPSGEGDPGVVRDTSNEVVLLLQRLDGNIDTPWVANEQVYLRVEDEIILGKWDATNTRLSGIKRGLYGTAVSQHSAPDAEWREGTFVVQQDSTGIAEVQFSKFTQGDSPEAIILQLLASSGTYGVLPEAWNGGFEPARIDVTSFETLRDTVHSGEHCMAWIDKPVEFKTLVVEHLLKPFGLYLVHGPDDLIRARYLRQGPPATTVATVDATQIIGQAQWQSGTPLTVGEYRLECDLDPLSGVEGDPSTIFVDVFTDTKRLFGKRALQVVHKSVFLHSADGSIVPAGMYRMAQKAFDSRRAFFLTRYSLPPPTVPLKVRWSLFQLQPGDTVTLNVPQIPSMSGPGRSYSGPADVTAYRPKDSEAAVELEFRLLGTALDHYGVVSPAAKVTSYSAGVITVSGRTYSYHLASSVGSDADTFSVGDKVVAVSPNFASISAVQTITAITNGDIAFITVTPGFGAGVGSNAGDILIFADYDSLTAAQQAKKTVSLADSNEQLGAAHDPGYRYTGI